MSHERTAIIADSLSRIYRKHRGLEPEVVVQVASDPDHPLHCNFEWDDSVAGHAWRIEQARRLIRSVEVEISTSLATLTAVAYVRNPNLESSTAGYISVEDLRGDRRSARSALRYECGRALSQMDRVRTIALALRLEKDVDAIVGRLEVLRDKEAA